MGNLEPQNLSGLEPKLIKLEFIIYLPKLKVNSCLENGFNLQTVSLKTPKITQAANYVAGFEPITGPKINISPNKSQASSIIANSSLRSLLAWLL